MACHPFRKEVADSGEAVDSIREKVEQSDIPKSHAIDIARPIEKGATPDHEDDQRKNYFNETIGSLSDVWQRFVSFCSQRGGEPGDGLY
jgi:hypothetical protein